MIRLSPRQDRLHDQIADLKSAALAALVARLRREHLAIPVMAVEVEFYLSGSRVNTYPKAILSLIDSAMREAGIAAHLSEEERGQNQFEVALKPEHDLERLAQNMKALPEILREALAAEGIAVDFSPKPFAEDFGNGLHWHLHLENRRGENLFTRSEGGSYSRELLWTLGGLLHSLPDAMLLFAPNAESYARFQQPKMNAPTTISWGANNRTTALRLPNKPLDAKHIEHRVAGGDADPWLCMLAILAGAANGLAEKIYPGEAIYGDASDAQYDCEFLPGYDEAVRLFGKSEIMQDYLGEELAEAVMRRMVYPDAF